MRPLNGQRLAYPRRAPEGFDGPLEWRCFIIEGLQFEVLRCPSPALKPALQRTRPDWGDDGADGLSATIVDIGFRAASGPSG